MADDVLDDLRGLAWQLVEDEQVGSNTGLNHGVGIAFGRDNGVTGRERVICFAEIDAPTMLRCLRGAPSGSSCGRRHCSSQRERQSHGKGAAGDGSGGRDGNEWEGRRCGLDVKRRRK